jgi:hypothetical protein
MFSFLFIQQTKSGIAEEFSSTMPCDCDITDKCDQFCCCDKDCNSSAIESFKERFCIPQSPISTVKITCDTKNRIYNSKYVGSFVVNDEIKCYYVEKELSDKDKIKNYNAQELGLNDFKEYLPSALLPESEGTSTTEFPLLNDTAGYVPFGIGSRSCNSLYLVRKGFEYDSYCYLNPDIVPTPAPGIYEFKNFFPEYVWANNASSQSLGGGKHIAITTDEATKEIKIQARTIDGNCPVGFKYTGMSDAESVPTSGAGYTSGLDLVSVIDIGTIPRYIYLEFAGQRIPFQGNTKFFLAVGNTTSSAKLFAKHDTYGIEITDPDYPNIFPSFANFPLGLTSRYMNFKIPNFTIEASDDAKHIIYTFMYKKFGYKTAFYYKFVGVNMDIVEEPSKMYHTIEIKQVELNDDGTSTFERETNELSTISLSSITDFMFKSITDITKTTGIIAIVILIVLIWMDSLFHQ